MHIHKAIRSRDLILALSSSTRRLMAVSTNMDYVNNASEVGREKNKKNVEIGEDEEEESTRTMMSRHQEGDGDDHGDGEEGDREMVMPGFRFHPTEEELIEFYLRRKVEGKRFQVQLIPYLDLYRYDPWELPAMAAIGEKEWYFYVPRDRKYRNGDRPNRVTTSGYWKATGADRMIRAENQSHLRPIGLKKTLVFYSGKAPKGLRSTWIMNEYRLPQHETQRHQQTEISLCRVYKRPGVEDHHHHSHMPRSLPSRQPSSSSSSRGSMIRRSSWGNTNSKHHQYHAHPQALGGPPSSSSVLSQQEQQQQIVAANVDQESETNASETAHKEYININNDAATTVSPITVNSAQTTDGFFDADCGNGGSSSSSCTNNVLLLDDLHRLVNYQNQAAASSVLMMNMAHFNQHHQQQQQFYGSSLPPHPQHLESQQTVHSAPTALPERLIWEWNSAVRDHSNR